MLDQTSSDIVLHIITDGRDRPTQAFKKDFDPILNLYRTHSNRIHISTLGGRFYGMDRDKNWDRIETYISKVQSDKPDHSFDEWMENYPHNEQSDEFIEPISFSHAPIQASDTVICCNFRADRAIQILKRIQALNPANIMGATNYPGLTSIHNLFPKPKASHGLGEVVSHQNIKQIRIAETEKYAHVTYFFNLLKDAPFPLEDRVLIPSDKVKSFDLMPNMKANEITQAVINGLSTYGLTVCNFANADMVGHTGNLKATISGIETVDQCLKKIHAACLKTNTALIITADHGNADQMLQQNGSPSTSHSLAKVPLVICNTAFEKIQHNDALTLDCIAPTVLDIMGLEKPKQMTSQSILCK